MTTTLSRPRVFAYDPGEFWDEMFVSSDEVRPYYAIIRYYLDEEPILPTIRTYLPSESDELQFLLEHIGELVVKSVNESGGYGMVIGPHSTRAANDEFRAYVWVLADASG